MMAQRTLLLLCYLVCNRTRWMVEQPSSSCSRKFKHLAWVPGPYPAGDVYAVHGHMGAFGSRTKKPTYWLGDAAFLPTMKQSIEGMSFASDLVTYREDGRVDGNTMRISQSQMYTQDAQAINIPARIIYIIS